MQVFALALVRIRQACLAGVGHVLPLFNAMTCVHALQALVCYRHACGVVWMVLACGTDGVASASQQPISHVLGRRSGDGLPCSLWPCLDGCVAGVIQRLILRRAGWAGFQQGAGACPSRWCFVCCQSRGRLPPLGWAERRQTLICFG